MGGRLHNPDMDCVWKSAFHIHPCGLIQQQGICCHTTLCCWERKRCGSVWPLFLASSYIGWVIWTFNNKECTQTHNGCSIHVVGSILIRLGLSISADGDLRGVRACTRFSMLITLWCAKFHNTGCGHWFNTLNGGTMVALVGICGIYLCMWLQKVNVIRRNNAECILNLGKIAVKHYLTGSRKVL